MGLIKEAASYAGNAFYANKKLKDEEKRREEGLRFVANLDYEPAYASDRVPTYKKTESPIARSYLESILMGNNPDMVSRVAPNAQFKRQQSQSLQNAMFGAPEERFARQREVDQEQPWKMEPMTDRVGYNELYGKSDLDVARGRTEDRKIKGTGLTSGPNQPFKGQGGLTEQEIAAAKQAGVNLDVSVKTGQVLATDPSRRPSGTGIGASAPLSDADGQAIREMLANGAGADEINAYIAQSQAWSDPVSQKFPYMEDYLRSVYT